jgi:hypothetical protein
MGKTEGKERKDKERSGGTKETNHVGCGSKENRRSAAGKVGQGQGAV